MRQAAPGIVSAGCDPGHGAALHSFYSCGLAGEARSICARRRYLNALFY